MSPSKKSQTATSDTLTEQLTYLKLSFILQQYDPLAKQAIQDQWGHVDYLAKLIEGEPSNVNSAASSGVSDKPVSL